MIRQLTLDDLPSAIEIEEHSFAYPKSAEILRLDIAAGKYWGAEIGGRIIGYIAFEPILDEVHILNLAVGKDFQRQGIASSLLGFVLERPAKFYLEVRESNQAAKKLYEKHGFAVIATRKKYYAPNYETALVMAKNASSFNPM